MWRYIVTNRRDVLGVVDLLWLFLCDPKRDQIVGILGEYEGWDEQRGRPAS